MSRKKGISRHGASVGLRGDAYSLLNFAVTNYHTDRII